MNQTFMKERPVVPLIVSMALPMIISMMVNSLYNIIDSYFVAKISEDSMTALSLVFPIQNFVSAVAIGFGIGINAVAAISLGAGDERRAEKAISQGVLLSVVHGLVLSVVSIALMPAFLSFFQAEEDVVQIGIRYSNVVFLFAVFNHLAITYEKIFQAVGRMKVSMFCMMVGCIANIILDPFMIFGIGPFPEMGIEGAALATGIGQMVTLVLYLLVYYVRPIVIKVKVKSMKLEKTMVGQLYSIGIPATLNLALSSILITLLNLILAAFSQTYVLVLGIYYKLQTFIYLSANGIVQGMRPVIGYNYGARESERVKKIYQVVLLMTGVIMLVGTVLCLWIPADIMGLFMENEENILIGARALRIICIGFVFSTVSVVSSGALEGIGKGLPSLVISLLRYVLLIVPVAFVLSKFMQADGVWLAFPVTEIIVGAVSYWLYKKVTSDI